MSKNFYRSWQKVCSKLSKKQYFLLALVIPHPSLCIFWKLIKKCFNLLLLLFFFILLCANHWKIFYTVLSCTLSNTIKWKYFPTNILHVKYFTFANILHWNKQSIYVGTLNNPFYTRLVKKVKIIIMCKDTVVIIRKIDGKFFKIVNECRPNSVNLEDIMSSYCNKQTKIMIVGEWQMNVVEFGKLIYRLKVSTLIFK